MTTPAATSVTAAIRSVTVAVRETSVVAPAFGVPACGTSVVVADARRV